MLRVKTGEPNLRVRQGCVIMPDEKSETRISPWWSRMRRKKYLKKIDWLTMRHQDTELLLSPGTDGIVQFSATANWSGLSVSFPQLPFCLFVLRKQDVASCRSEKRVVFCHG